MVEKRTFLIMKEEYDKIVFQIEELQKRKSELEKLMIESSDSFVEKFKIWFNSEDDGHHDWLITYPLLRDLFDRIDARRGQTYHLPDLIGEDEFWAFMDGDEDDEYFNLKSFLKRYQPALEEAMKHNMKSFKCDW
jgi:hypothetical protein